MWVRPDGGLYITDPYYSRDYWKRGPMEQDVQGVYYLPPGGTALVRVVGDMRTPNGIIGTPDGKTLYVSDLGAGKTWAFNIERDGTLSHKRPFCDLGSDGMTIDSAGDVYLTGHGVTVFDKTGLQDPAHPHPGRMDRQHLLRRPRPAPAVYHGQHEHLRPADERPRRRQPVTLCDQGEEHANHGDDCAAVRVRGVLPGPVPRETTSAACVSSIWLMLTYWAGDSSRSA